MDETPVAPTASVSVEYDELGYAVVTIERPHKRNAMNRAARRDFHAALRDTAAAGVKAVVLTGAERSFCAGVDLKEYAADLRGGVVDTPETDWAELNLAIRAHPAVFIAAVNGVALGGGVTLIGVCDLAIAADDAVIGLPEVSFGAFPQLAGPAAQFHLTPKRAAWLALTAGQIDGATAARWGLVNEAMSAAELMTRARAIATRVSGFGADVLAKAKAALDTGPGAERPWRRAFERGVQINTEIRAAAQARQKEPA